MPATGNNFISPQAIRAANAVTTTANTTYTDTPTNTALLWTAGANGSRITKLTSQARATLTATEMQLFRSTDGGTTKRYFDSKSYPAFTFSSTSVNPRLNFGYNESDPLILAPNEQLFVAQGVTLAGGIVSVAEGGDY